MPAVIGLAGAGKSTLLSVARAVWEQQGYRVHGAALAGKAADSLQSASGIPSRTLAKFERAMLSEPTKQGLKAARKRGKRLGRPPKISNRQIRAAQQKLALKEATIDELAALNGVHPWTLRRRKAELEDRS